MKVTIKRGGDLLEDEEVNNFNKRTICSVALFSEDFSYQQIFKLLLCWEGWGPYRLLEALVTALKCYSP